MLSDEKLLEKVNLVIDQNGSLPLIKVVKLLYGEKIINYFFNQEYDGLMFISRKNGELFRHPNVTLDPSVTQKVFSRNSSPLEREQLMVFLKAIETDLGTGLI